MFADRRNRGRTSRQRPRWLGADAVSRWRTRSAHVLAVARYLDAAKEVGIALRVLEDTERGGFYSVEASKSDALERRRPPDDNVAAARFYLALFSYSKDDSFKATAERTFRFVAARKPTGGEAALAAEELLQGPVEFSVLGDRKDPATQSLFQAAQTVYEPRKVLHYEKPGRYPDYGRPAMHICTWEACTPPIFDPAGVAAAAKTMAWICDSAKLSWRNRMKPHGFFDRALKCITCVECAGLNPLINERVAQLLLDAQPDVLVARKSHRHHPPQPPARGSSTLL